MAVDVAWHILQLANFTRGSYGLARQTVVLDRLQREVQSHDAIIKQINEKIARYDQADIKIGLSNLADSVAAGRTRREREKYCDQAKEAFRAALFRSGDPMLRIMGGLLFTACWISEKKLKDAVSWARETASVGQREASKLAASKPPPQLKPKWYESDDESYHPANSKRSKWYLKNREDLEELQALLSVVDAVIAELTGQGAPRRLLYPPLRGRDGHLARGWHRPVLMTVASRDTIVIGQVEIKPPSAAAYVAFDGIHLHFKFSSGARFSQWEKIKTAVEGCVFPAVADGTARWFPSNVYYGLVGEFGYCKYFEYQDGTLCARHDGKDYSFLQSGLGLVHWPDRTSLVATWYPGRWSAQPPPKLSPPAPPEPDPEPIASPFSHPGW